MAQGSQTKLTEGRSAGELIALALSVGWMIMVGLFFFFLPPTSTVADRFDSLRFILILIAIFMPVAMIWVAAAASRSARIMQEESGRLQAAIDGMRKTYIENRAGPVGGGMQPTVEKKLNEIAQATRKTENTVATFASTRPEQKLQITSVRATIPDDQPTLALGTSAEDISTPLPNTDLIRALNFPDNEQDTRGFNALRLALKDRNARQLVQASQDILTLMSQDGIYMDDLRPDRARSEIWRRFAHGERGRAMASLGGVRDRSSLALTSGRMREDTIFRDAAHHFLRRFDQTLITFEPGATDEEISALSETRTARAFMLLGRVTGAFD
jgi:hypothetical protein